MKYNNLIVSLAAALLLAANPAKAQTNEVQLDVDGIMRVCAPVPIVTFAPHPTNGKWEWTGPNGFHSNERHNQIFDFDEKMEGEYIGTYTNEAGCRDQLVITLKLKE